MAATDVLSFWGRDGLRRWRKNDLDRSEVDDASKAYLGDIGLPALADWTLRFEPSVGLPGIGSRPSCRIIGYDGSIPLCIDSARAGIVIAVENESPWTECYLNLDVARLGDVLAVYQQYRIDVLTDPGDEERAQRLIDATEARMRAADPSAFTHVDHYWPVMIEQMRDGLL